MKKIIVTRSTLLALALSLILVPACSGSSDDDDDDDNNDTVEVDAAGGGDVNSGVTLPDAAAGVDAAATVPGGFGQVCDDGNLCPTTGATMCAVLTAGSNTGFCTMACGTSGSTSEQPAGGDATCAAAAGAISGTPACVLYGQAGSDGQVPWSCAILCGTHTSGDLGTCPAGLTCGAVSPNLCYP